MRTITFLKLLVISILISVNGTTQAQKKSPEFWVDLWQNGLPNSNGMEHEGYNDKKHNFKPSICVYLPAKAQKPTKAVVICPGGGYGHLALRHEGYDWGTYLNSLNIAAIVLRYRMPNGNREVPMSDAYEAIRYVKEHATEWNINPNCIGIMGASAGGHLASTIATHAEDELRPAFQILLYPVISMKQELTHSGSRRRFIGENPTTELEQEFSNELQVDVKTPRTFITWSEDDRTVKPANSHIFYEALKKQNIPVEAKIFPTGGHGWGIKLSFTYHAEMLLALKQWFETF